MISMTPQQLWQAALGELELALSKANFTTWFKNTFVSEVDDSRVTISVPNAFTKAWLEKKYHSAILKALQNVLNTPIRDVQYRVEAARAQTSDAPRTGGAMPAAAAVAVTETPLEMPVSAPPAVQESAADRIRRHYTFENFVVGKGNELAHAAAVAVAETPGNKYNPLFIYGGVGLGKTHLLQAIGNAMVERNQAARILYVTCEQFTNDYIAAVRAGLAKEFKERYRTVDLLIVDDVQFLANKEGTQEEFFHTFNSLHPGGIPTLEARLASRLNMGMVVDISAPDLETRIAILRSKCQERNCQLSDDILNTIATAITSNVRELEGALNKIVAFHQFKNLQPTAESVKGVLASYTVNPPKKTITAKQLIAAVSAYYDLNIEDLLGKSREKKLAFPRQVLMFLMREEMKASFPAIGAEVGSRDHTTAIHACMKISQLLEKDEKLRQDVALLKERVYQMA
jgi:chromosomal replication initiator protein